MRYSSISNRTVVVEFRPISSHTFQGFSLSKVKPNAHLLLCGQGLCLKVDCERCKERDPGGGGTPQLAILPEASSWQLSVQYLRTRLLKSQHLLKLMEMFDQVNLVQLLHFGKLLLGLGCQLDCLQNSPRPIFSNYR